MGAGRARARGRRILALLAVAGWACGARAQADGAGGEGGTPAAKEAELAAAELARQNAELRAVIERLSGDIRRLQVSLAAAQAELDVLKARRDDAAWKASAEGVTAQTLGSGPMAVIDVNRDLNLVVLDAGSSKGVRPGMRFSVVRDDRAVARVRAVDVRERIAGAIVEEAEPGRYPGKGDRIVVRRSEDR
jgi:hypothetical protein